MRTLKLKYRLALCLLCVTALAACKKDNYDEPKSMLTGRIVYQGQPLGVRSDGVQLELWQHGYQLFTKIPVYVNQDGTFSASLFDGNYKLVRMPGNGPWVDNTDSIDVRVDGSVSVDVPVEPYFIITNASFQRNGNSIAGSITVERVHPTRPLELVRLYVGQTTIVDQNNSAANAQVLGSAISLNQPVTLNVNIPANLQGKDAVFVRAGVKADGVAEFIYSPVTKISLN